MFYTPDELPRTDLGLDGTAWYMAPEVLGSEVYPVSDVWAAGVMAYQLLSGYLPFDDKKNRSHASLSLIWCVAECAPYTGQNLYFMSHDCWSDGCRCDVISGTMSGREGVLIVLVSAAILLRRGENWGGCECAYFMSVI